MAIEVPPELVQSTNFRYPPQIEAGPDGRLMSVSRDIEEIGQPFEDTFAAAGHRAQKQFSAPHHHTELTPSPTTGQFVRTQSASGSRNVHSPGRSTSQQHNASAAPSQDMYGFYDHGAHRSALRPGNSPHSPQMPPYSPFEALPAHSGNAIYPPYQSPTHAHQPPGQQQAHWGYETTASTHAGHMSSATPGQHVLSTPIPDASTWATMGHPLPGQPLTSAPPMPSPIVSSLPMRSREHMRTRSTPTTWTMDHSHGSQLHAPVARYPGEAHRGGTSSMPGYGEGGNNENT